ncbi:hypothetical protein Q5P01_007920 [Channa striata]|uniref:BHLH domain-containing protein n=1 Tax=Channa striata TaxID=64152 RepID=A0AA88N966_CHASR|nr:hypothetical protein Q5P01_007920 [Channa striata]
MPSFSPACKTAHASPLFREHEYDPMHILGTELGLMEMTEVEYTHLQQQANPAAAMAKDATGSTVVSPLTSTQAIDLSTSTAEHCLVMPGEKTPAYGDVPDHVLAKIKGDGSPDTNRDTSSLKRSKSARVCLEKRFTSMAAECIRPQDVQPTVLNNFLTVRQHSAESRDTVIHPHMQKWMKTDQANPFDVSSPYVGAVFNPVTNLCGQVIGHIPHIIEPSNHQGLFFPKSFSLNCKMIGTKPPYTSSSSQVGEQQLVNQQSEVATPAASSKHNHARKSQPSKATKASTETAGQTGKFTRKRAQRCALPNQRRERHNSKERERRKRIRLCCDKLNVLVPFCDSNTDKVTTLQWTTEYLRYINKTYGDTFKEEFQKLLTDGREIILKPSTSSGHDNQEANKT